MSRGSDGRPEPVAGTAVDYDEDGFHAPEIPVIPFSPGADEAAVSATRRMLDAAAEEMGREIDWLRVPTEGEARTGEDDGVPAEAVEAFRRFRVGLHGPLAESRSDALAREATLRRRLELTAAVSRHTSARRQPSPPSRTPLDVALFRDVSAPPGTALEYGPGTAEGDALAEFMRDTTADDRLADDSVGYSVTPTSRRATETLVDEALSYAFDRDKDTVTLAHQGDLRPGSEGSFRTWAREYVDDEYGDSVVDEATFRDEYESYPEEELVLLERRTDELCRALVVDPGEYDVLVAPSLGGVYLSAVARGAAGESGDDAAVGIGDGRLVAAARPTEQRDGSAGVAPVSLVLSGCLLFEYLGWDDAATALRTAVATTLAEHEGPPAGIGSHSLPGPRSPSAFADAVVSRLNDPERGPGGVRSTPAERSSIQGAIATLYNAVFDDQLSPEDVELNQLLNEDEEAEVALPEVGINFYYWRRWPVERKIEVLLHELAHVEEEEGERDHGDAFYDRLVELTAIAAEWEPELEEAFGEPIEFDRVRRFIVDSVNEATIETDLESVDERKQWLREQFSLE